MFKVLKKIFEPNKIVGFLFFNLGMLLLIYVFARHMEGTFLAYLAYFLSTYALIIFVIWFVRACHFTHNKFTESRIYKHYQKHEHFWIRFFFCLSIIVNFVYGIFKLGTGVFYRSEWFITLAVYYLLLFGIKVALILSMNKEDEVKENKKLKWTGILLLALDVILAGMIILILHQKENIVYPGYLIYLVALYDFYLIIMAIVNVVKFWGHKRPVMLASKVINLTVAMMAMISLEVAMTNQFGESDVNFRTMVVFWTGLVVTLINSIMAIYMIWISKKNLMKLSSK